MFEVETAKTLALRTLTYIESTKAIADAERERYLQDDLTENERTALMALSSRQLVHELHEIVSALAEAILALLNDRVTATELGIDP